MNPSSDKKLQLHPSPAELLDRLSVDQIKLVLGNGEYDGFLQEMADIEHDVNELLQDDSVEIDARFVRLVIALAQINLHIWKVKETMNTDSSRFEENMKLAHQLNGIRNQIKNRINECWGEKAIGSQLANIGTEGLLGWDMSALNKPDTTAR